MRLASLAALALGAVPAWAAGPAAPPAPDLSAYQTRADAQAQMAQEVAAIPQPAASAPPATALDGAQGIDSRYARADHTHAARVQRTVITTAADGTATWTFARPIAVPAGRVPPVAYMVEDTGTPIVVQVTGRSMTSAGGLDTHTAVAVRAQRSRTLPGVLATLAPLVGFDIFGGSAAGVRVNLWAADPTQ